MKNGFAHGALPTARQAAQRGSGQTGHLSEDNGPLPDEQCRTDTRLAAGLLAFDREMLTVEEVAAMLAIGVRSVWRKSQDGRLPPPIRMTGSTRWAKTTLQDWIAEQAAATSKKKHARRRG